MCGCAPVYYGRDYAGMIVHVAYGETMPVRRGVAKMLTLRGDYASMLDGCMRRVWGNYAGAKYDCITSMGRLRQYDVW